MNQNPIYNGLKIGDWTYGKPTTLYQSSGSTLEIGKFCSIAANVTIFLGGEHRTDWITTYPFTELFPRYSYIKGHPRTKGNVKIGNDVWIGRNVTILSGVIIGDGAVIGVGSVVAKSVDPYSVVAGNPAKVIRLRFSEKQVNDLLKIAWWNWNLTRIEEAMPLLLSKDIDAFLSKYKSSGSDWVPS